MSSSVDTSGNIAAAVMLPVAAAYGVGWLAWQAGSLLVELNREADREIEEIKSRPSKEELYRRYSALANHRQLINMCNELLAEIEKNQYNNKESLEELKGELKAITAETIPENTHQLESINSLGFSRLEKIVEKEKQLFEISNKDMYSSVEGLMNSMKTTIATAEIYAGKGENISVPDADALERVELNERLADITERFTVALENALKLSYEGLGEAGTAWFHSCFNGVDNQIDKLYMPSTTNEELKRGIKRLEDLLNRYEVMAPEIEKEQKRLLALYKVYVDASRALGEHVENIKSFKNADAVEKRLFELKKRSERAEVCAEIYKKLGRTAYLCYAWDQELQALGYSVHSKKTIGEMSGHKPENAVLGENKLPFYNWNDEALTQLYSMTADCSLQVIVHENGEITMKALSDEDNEKTREVQNKHCELCHKWAIIHKLVGDTPSPVRRLHSSRGNRLNAD